MPRLQIFERFAWVALISVALGFAAIGAYVVNVRLHATTETRTLVALSDGWKRVRYWLVEEETRERKYLIERIHLDRPYHHTAVQALAKVAHDLERISAPQDVAAIENLIADNDRYGRAMQRMFDAVDARDDRSVGEIHEAIDPTYDRMERVARDAEGRYGHAEYLALAQLEETQFNITRTLPVLVLLALFAVGACLLIIREYRRRSNMLFRAQLESLEAAAHDDALTHLGNHRAFRSALAERARDASPGTVHLALIDVDHFKNVNDRYGHVYGDALLCKVGEVLRRATTATPFRVGGDEFALLFRDVGILAACEQLERVRSEAVDGLGGQTLSIGIASFEGRAYDLTAIHERADVALYEAKHRGRNNVVRFESSLIVSSSSLYARRLALERILAAQASLAIVFQPIYRIDGTLVGFEALTRFGSDFASPLDAFDVAERLDLTPALDRRCIASVAATIPADFDATIFLNISPTTLANGALARSIFDDFVRVTSIAPDRITIELTEQTRISPAAVETIETLRAAGFLIALDDAGSGNSGLAIIAAIALDVVKIDGALTSAADSDERACAVVEGLFLMAERLRCTIVMEGIETDAHIARARGLARRHDIVDRFFLQGYALGRPAASLDGTPAIHPRLQRVAGTNREISAASA